MNTSPFRIGMITRVAISEFKFALESGFDCVELSTNPGAFEFFMNSLSELSQWRKYFPIPITAIGYFGVEYHQDPKEYRNLLQLMDVCQSLQTKIIHIGGGSSTNDPAKDMNRIIKFFGDALEEAKKRELTLALYTCKVSNFAWDPKYWDILFKELPDLKIKYDPSHAYHTGKKRDYLAEIKALGNRIVHFHAKGGYLSADGKRDPMGDPPPGEDQISWPAILQALIDAQYEGVVSIELHSDRYSYEEYYNTLRRSKDYLRRVNKELIDSRVSQLIS